MYNNVFLKNTKEARIGRIKEEEECIFKAAKNVASLSSAFAPSIMLDRLQVLLLR